MSLTLDEVNEISRMIELQIMRWKEVEHISRLGHSEIKIEIGSFACVLIGVFVTLVILAVGSWF